MKVKLVQFIFIGILGGALTGCFSGDLPLASDAFGPSFQPAAFPEAGRALLYIDFAHLLEEPTNTRDKPNIFLHGLCLYTQHTETQ